ncbi:MAG: hypothetical protein LBK52_07025 [Deltaproteobacteria bacterium]|jgi:DNA-directed RNA polymerase sigma subunit (sigma70/sigma32)|nr:hypothetical protein [Deltaproteobacteria bacterium]
MTDMIDLSELSSLVENLASGALAEKGLPETLSPSLNPSLKDEVALGRPIEIYEKDLLKAVIRTSAGLEWARTVRQALAAKTLSVGEVVRSSGENGQNGHVRDQVMTVLADIERQFQSRSRCLKRLETDPSAGPQEKKQAGARLDHYQTEIGQLFLKLGLVRNQFEEMFQLLESQSQRLAESPSPAGRCRDTSRITAAEMRSLLEELEIKKRLAQEARHNLVKANINLVLSPAKKYQNHGLPLTDLVRAGLICLQKAVDRIDYHSGYRLSPQAGWLVRQAITRQVTEKGGSSKISVHWLETIKTVQKTTESLFGELGREPTDQEIALKLALPLEKVRQALQLSVDPALAKDSAAGSH